jgi:hypothetical protein
MANSVYLDASALAKRYIPENGSVRVDAILNTVPANRIHVLNVGAGELMWILVRKRNARSALTRSNLSCIEPHTQTECDRRRRWQTGPSGTLAPGTREAFACA